MYEAILYDKIEDKLVKCKLCSHYCEIKPGKTGKCMVRENIDGELFTYSFGASTGFSIDPIEKKPFYHFKPGSSLLSFGTPGCNFKCKNCQNWQLSYADRNTIKMLQPNSLPGMIVDLALKYKADGIAYTYSEPTIFFEYARETINECRKLPDDVSFFHVFISNGFMTKETIEIIKKEKLISAINIDLKFMNNEKYLNICGSRLLPVLDNIKRFDDLRNLIHTEIINLVIPGENDNEDDFTKLSEFILSVNPEIPLHFSRFYPTNKMKDKQPTPINTLLKAKEIATSSGINYVYLGNTSLPNVENTLCPKCNYLLIERKGYAIVRFNIDSKTKKCPNCEHKINIVL